LRKKVFEKFFFCKLTDIFTYGNIKDSGLVLLEKLEVFMCNDCNDFKNFHLHKKIKTLRKLHLKKVKLEGKFEKSIQLEKINV
jgi:hypothetical protein